MRDEERGGKTENEETKRAQIEMLYDVSHYRPQTKWAPLHYRGDVTEAKPVKTNALRFKADYTTPRSSSLDTLPLPPCRACLTASVAARVAASLQDTAVSRTLLQPR